MRIPQMMIAAWYEKFGLARDVISLGELSVPSIGLGEVLVRVASSGLNPHDVKKRSGWLGGPMPAGKVIPHGDGAGTVVALAPDVSNIAIGDRVWLYGASHGRPGIGTAAQYVTVPAAHALPLPDSVSFDEGASLGVPTLTAYYALLSDGPVTGQWVLVQGGAGAVGSVAIELARWNGARVIATVSSPEKAVVATAAGADHVIDYHRDDVIGHVMELTRGVGVDRIVEVDFGDNVLMNAAVLRGNGTLASYSSTRVREPVFRYYDFAAKGCRIHLVQATTMPSAIRGEASRVIGALLDRGLLVPRIARRFTLPEIAGAHELLESGDALGNIVVTLPIE